MDKLIAMHNEEQLDEERLKQIISHRDQILKLVGEIATMQEQTQKEQYKIKVTGAQVFQLETDVCMLNRQVEEINRSLRSKLEHVLNDEEQLKKSKVSFHNSIRERTEKAKQFLARPKIKAANNEANIPSDIQKAAWRLQGENDAFSLIQEFQTNKLQEIESIRGLARRLFDADLEEERLKNAN